MANAPVAADDDPCSSRFCAGRQASGFAACSLSDSRAGAESTVSPRAGSSNTTSAFARFFPRAQSLLAFTGHESAPGRGSTSGSAAARAFEIAGDHF